MLTTAGSQGGVATPPKEGYAFEGRREQKKGQTVSFQWFYEADGERRGPFSPGTLKQLAESGAVTADTLVWREGLAEWVPAKAIKGLCPSTPVTPPAPDPVDPPVTPAVPQIIQSAKADFLEPVLAAVRDGSHPFDLLVVAVRKRVSVHALAQLSRLASQAGIYAAYGAAGFVLLGGLLLAMRTNRLTPIGGGVGLAIGLIVLQYVSYKLLNANETAISTNKTVLSSLAIPDCAFVLIVAGSITGSLGLAWLASGSESSRMAISAFLVLTIGLYIAAVAVQPSGVGVVVDPDCRAAEEAVGVATFVLKLFLRAVPIFFAMGVIVGTFKTASLCWTLLMSRRLEVEVFDDLQTAGSLLFTATAIPLFAYVLTLTYYLTLDVILAIVSMPAKLDRLAEGVSGSEGAE